MPWHWGVGVEAIICIPLWRYGGSHKWGALFTIKMRDLEVTPMHWTPPYNREVWDNGMYHHHYDIGVSRMGGFYLNVSPVMIPTVANVQTKSKINQLLVYVKQIQLYSSIN